MIEGKGESRFLWISQITKRSFCSNPWPFPGCTNKACGKLVLVIPDEAATIF